MDEVNFERNLHGFILSVLHAACSESEAEALHKTTLETNKEIEETASEAERTDVFRDIRSKELGRLMSNKGNIIDMRSEKVGVTANGEERAAFFRNTRKEERLAFFQSIKERERKWKEERDNTRMRKRQVKIKMFAEFHLHAVSPLMISYSSVEQDPGQSKSHNHLSGSLNPSSPVNLCLQEPVNSLLAESRDTN